MFFDCFFFCAVQYCSDFLHLGHSVYTCYINGNGCKAAPTFLLLRIRCYIKHGDWGKKQEGHGRPIENDIPILCLIRLPLYLCLRLQAHRLRCVSLQIISMPLMIALKMWMSHVICTFRQLGPPLPPPDYGDSRMTDHYYTYLEMNLVTSAK